MLEYILLSHLDCEKPILPRAPKEVREAVFAFYLPLDLANIGQCSRAHLELVEGEIDRIGSLPPRVGSLIRQVVIFNAAEVVQRRRN